MPQGKLRFLYENLEYCGLDLEELLPEEMGVHCEFCAHRNHSHIWIVLWNVIIIFVISFLIVVISFVNLSSQVLSVIYSLLWIAFFLLIVASILEFLGIRRDRISNIPPFPLVGRDPKIQVQELLRGKVILDSEGIYEEFAETPKGNLFFSVRLTPNDFERYKKYKKKFGVKEHIEISESAGFIAFETKNSLIFLNEDSSNRKQATTLPLKKMINWRASRYDQSRSQWIWSSDHSYEIMTLANQERILPVQLIPTIVNEGSSQALELTVQVNNEFHGYDLRANPVIEELHLYAPTSLTNCKNQEPPSRKSLRRDDKLEMIWSNQELNQGKDEVYYRTFFLLFINPVRENMEFSGFLRVRLEGAFSGIDNLKLFYPWGKLRSDGGLTKEDKFTDVIVDFQLTLQHAFLRKFYTLAPPIIKIIGLIPNYDMVIRLVEQLNYENIYVQRVIENPATTSSVDAQTRNRYWDIAGRYYYGVYPIDFHLVVTGKEKYTNEELPTTGESSFEIKIHSTVTTDTHLEDEVKAFEKKLIGMINHLND